MTLGFYEKSLLQKLMLVAVFSLAAAQAAGEDCPLCAAAESGELAEVRRLLAEGASPDAAAAETDDPKKRNGWTALMFAADKDHADIVQTLLDAGANPNAANKEGFNALINAAAKSSPQTVKTLLDAGANPNAPTILGYTALMHAAINENTAAVKTLLDAGAKPNAAMKDGYTALMGAAKRDYEAAKMLLDAGANSNAADNRGRTALMSAAHFGHADIVKMLLAAGANPNAKSDGGSTALFRAAYPAGEYRSDIVRILLKGGARLDLWALVALTVRGYVIALGLEF